MTRLFTAELLKLRTLRSTWGFVLVALAFAGLVTAGHIGGTSGTERLDPEFQFGLVLDAAFPGSVLALLLGITLVTNEFRHGTIARTLLATPRRARFVAVKLVTGATTGAALMAAMLVVVIVTAAIWLEAVDVSLEPAEATDGIGRALLVTALAGTLGAAIGGTVHSQVGALVGTLLWIFVLEPICWVVLGLLDLDRVAGYLPAASLGGAVDSTNDTQTWARSVSVALGWTILASVLALLRTRKRDIT